MSNSIKLHLSIYIANSIANTVIDHKIDDRPKWVSQIGPLLMGKSGSISFKDYIYHIWQHRPKLYYKITS